MKHRNFRRSDGINVGVDENQVDENNGVGVTSKRRVVANRKIDLELSNTVRRERKSHFVVRSFVIVGVYFGELQNHGSIIVDDKEDSDDTVIDETIGGGIFIQHFYFKVAIYVENIA